MLNLNLQQSFIRRSLSVQRKAVDSVLSWHGKGDHETLAAQVIWINGAYQYEVMLKYFSKAVDLGHLMLMHFL